MGAGIPAAYGLERGIKWIDRDKRLARSVGIMMKRQMGARQAKQAKLAEDDAADLQQLIRYVERWRMAQFQRPDDRLDQQPDDRRLGDADDLLEKLRTGLQLAAQAGAALTDTVTGGRSALLSHLVVSAPG